jgi:hypothetical protein
MFEPGFPAHKRLVNFAYKGVIFRWGAADADSG